TWAVILVGETNIRGARIPSKYTWVSAKVVGSCSRLRSAETPSAGASVRGRFGSVLRMETSVFGAILAASPPPLKFAPLAVAVITVLVETAVASVMLL